MSENAEMLATAEMVLKQVQVCPRCEDCRESANCYFELKKNNERIERHIVEPEKT